MTNVTTRIETTARIVVALPLPSNWTEVSNALATMRQELIDRNIDHNWDDVVTVEADDDELRFVAVIGVSG